MLAHRQKLGRGRRIGAVRHHAVHSGQLPVRYMPRSRRIAQTHHRTPALREQVGAAQPFAGPHCLELDLGIDAELIPFDRQAQIDRIAIMRVGKAQPDRARNGGAAAIDRHIPRPHRRADAALGRERRPDPALRNFGEQAERTVEVGFAAAVRATDDGQRGEFDRELRIERYPAIARRAITLPAAPAPRSAAGGHVR